MKEEQILFNHFLCGINYVANDLYDMNPLKCKEFTHDEIISMFHKFESIVVSRDTFWKKSSEISYIYEDKHFCRVLKELELGNQQYYLINNGYETDDGYMHFFTPPMYSTCFCAVQASSHGYGYDSSYCSSPQGPFYLNYLSVSSQMRKYYGEGYYEDVIIPHMAIFKKVIVEILSLKKFSHECVKINLIALLKDVLNEGNLDEYHHLIAVVKKHELGNVYAKEILSIENTCKSIEASVKRASKLKDSVDKVFDALENKDYSLFSKRVFKLNYKCIQLKKQTFIIYRQYKNLKERLKNFIKELETTWTQVVFLYVIILFFKFLSNKILQRLWIFIILNCW